MSKSGWWQPLLFRLAVTFSDLRLGVITWCSWHHLILVTSLLSARLLQCEWVGRWVAPRTEENNVVKVSDILCPELTVSGQSVPTQGGRPQRPLVIWNVNYRDNTDLRGQHFLNVARFPSINRWFLLNMKGWASVPFLLLCDTCCPSHFLQNRSFLAPIRMSAISIFLSQRPAQTFTLLNSWQDGVKINNRQPEGETLAISRLDRMFK